MNNNNLPTINQNSQLILAKSKSLLDITQKILAQKNNKDVVESFKDKPFLREYGHSSYVNSVAFSPDGKTIVSGSRTLKLWDSRSGECLKTLEGQSNTVYSVAFSPDGKTIVSGSGDGTLKLWDLSSGECLLAIDNGYEVAIDSNGYFVAFDEAIDKYIRISEAPLTQRKLNKKEIEHFRKKTL